MEKHYLQIEFTTANFFEYSKEKKEGYEFFEGKKSDSYRKYYKHVDGTLESASLYDGKFGQQISLCLKKDGEIYYLTVPLYNQKNEIDPFAQSLITLLPNLKKGMNVSVSAFNFVPQGSKYRNIGIAIKSEGEKVVRAFTFKDVPKLEFSEKHGKKRPTATSLEKRNDFFLEKMDEALKSLKWEEKESETSKVETETPKKQEKESSKVKIDDDLPF